MTDDRDARVGPNPLAPPSADLGDEWGPTSTPSERTAEWDEAVRGSVTALLETELAALIDEHAIAAAVGAALEPGWLATVSTPATERATRFAIERLRARPETLADLIPEPARLHLEAIAADPNLMSMPLLSELLEDPAVESLIHDVLFDALRQFSQRINPFTADWGLPALLKLLPPIGFGGLRAAFEARRAEFEQRIEPEIRRFLAGFTRRAGQRLAELVVRKQQEPEFVALRRRVVAALLEQPLGRLLWPADDPKTSHLLAAVAETLAAPRVRRLVEEEATRTVAELRGDSGERRVGELLAHWGIELPPDSPQPVVFARAGYPLARAAQRTR